MTEVVLGKRIWLLHFTISVIQHDPVGKKGVLDKTIRIMYLRNVSYGLRKEIQSDKYVHI